ncbi:MAG: GNAT family N-acetyltransferase [Candidatus Methanoperedens sp.]|nr:GNAT family N-acetyltransferase [Candidatus Methanoperedens sp.]
MHEISNHNLENQSISEFFRYRTEYGELQCHRLKMPDGMAGELILKVLDDEKALSIEEVFVSRKFRNSGLGSRLLSFAEKTASTLGFRYVELRPFSTDPLVSDTRLQEWYTKRGYRPDGGKMYKRLNNGNFEVTS